MLFDFRIGAVLLIVLLPLSATTLFPQPHVGITGLNPINLLLAGDARRPTCCAGGSQRPAPLVPQPLLWLYMVPIVVAGLIGMPHVDEIPPVLLRGSMVVNLHRRGPATCATRW